MSRVTLTKKANGRYYLGMGVVELATLREVVSAGLHLARGADLTLTCLTLERLKRALDKPARGET